MICENIKLWYINMSEEDFDLDDFNLDDFDPIDSGDIENKVKDPKKSDKRQAVEDVFEGSIEGVKSYVKDKDKIRDFILKALPDEYTSIHQEVDKTAGDMRSLYDSAIKDIKPKIHSVASKIDRLIPENQKFLKDTLKNIKESTETRSYQGESQKDIQDKTIQTSIEDIFKTKEERDKKNKLLDEAIDTKKFKITDDRLVSIDTNLAQLTSYTTNITQAYQKKSLELQYKSYFVQSELLKTTSDLSKVLTKQNEAIVKNTALPEFVKIRNSEVFKASIKQRTANALTNSLFSKNSLITTLGGNLKNAFSQLKEGIISGLEAAETITDTSLMEREMGEMLGNKKSGAYKLGKTISTSASGFIADKVAGKIKDSISEDNEISKVGKDVYKYFKDPGLLKDKLENSDFISNAEIGSIKSVIGETLIDLISSGNKTNLSGKVTEEESLTSPGIFTNRTNKSITEVIPGYLSRILRELNIIRTGDVDSPLVLYDTKASKFITEKTVHSRLEKELKESINNVYTNDSVKSLISHITKNDDLTNSDEAKKLMIKAIMNSSSSSPERLIRTLRNIDHPLSNELIKGIENNIINSNNRSVTESTLTNKFISSKESLVNINKTILDYIDSGYSDVLEKSGIIDIDTDGTYTINKDKYIELAGNGRLNEILSNGKVVENNITNNTNTYEPTTTYSESVFSNFNGEELNETLIKIYDTNYKSESILEKIYNRLNDVLDVRIESIETSNKSNKTRRTDNRTTNEDEDKFIPETTLGYILLDAYKNSKDIVSKIFNKGSSLIENLYNKFDKNKDFFKTYIEDTLTNSLNIVKNVTDKIKEKTYKLINLKESGVEFIKKGFEKITDYTGDVYIPGINTPVLKSTLIKAGYYIDEKTGKVIQSVKDITGPVIDTEGNIVLTLEDFAKGLYDSSGNKIKIGYEKAIAYIKDKISKGLKRAKDTFNFIKDNILYKGIDKVNEVIDEKISFSGTDKIYDVLVEIRDIIKAKLNNVTRPTNSQFGDEEVSDNDVPEVESKYKSDTGFSIKNIKDKITNIRDRYKSSKAKDIYDKTKSKITDLKDSKKKTRLGSIFSKISDKTKKTRGFISGALGSILNTSDNNQSTDIPKEPKEESKVEKIKKKAQKVKGFVKSRGIIDDDANGIKDNSVLDRLKKEQEREEARKGKVSKADLSLKYRQGNVLDNILSKLSGFMSKAGDILESLAGLASIKGMKDTIGSIFNKDKTKSVKPTKKPLKGIKGLANKAVNMAKNAGKLALGTTGTIARTAAMVGGSLLTGLGYATTAALSVLSSPVVLGAAALAATGYGLYKAYKFITEDNYNDYEKIRLTQYGLTLTELDKHHVHELLNLEKYLNEDKVGYNNGVAYLLSRKIDIKEMYSIFSIDEVNEEMTSRFLDWFENRFKPFFLTNLTALFSVNRKVELDEIDDLTNEEKSKYLSLISFDSGPYSYPTSPFIDLDTLTDTSNISKTYLNEVISKVSGDRATSSKPSELKSNIEKSKKIIDDNKTSSIVNKAVTDFNKEEEKRKLSYKDKTKSNIQKTYTKTFTGEEANIKEDTSVPSDSKVNIPKTAPGPLSTGDEGYSFIKKSKRIDIEGLNPAMKKNFLAMAEEYGKLTGKSIHVNSAYRSTEEQKRLYRQNPRKAARPGRSLHEFGLAVDINTSDANELDKLGLMRKYGFTRPVGGETWHTEPAGIQGRIPEVKINKSLATELVESSIGRGGGGYATLKTAKKNRRDNKYALSLLEAPVKLSTNSDVKTNTDISVGGKFTGMEKNDSKVIDIKTKQPLTLANVQNFDKKPDIKPENKGTPDLKVVKTTTVKQEDIKAANDNGEKKPKSTLTVFKKPSKQTDSGQSLASTNIDSNVTIISETLTETLEVHKEVLNVQKDMLEFIKLVAENTDPDKLNEAKEVLSRPTNTSRNEQRTDLPINLKRRV